MRRARRWTTKGIAAEHLDCVDRAVRSLYAQPMAKFLEGMRKAGLQ